ncbi:LytTR family DNA-binding domain-containing protein [Gimibacter soli]|uniref:LytTR family DNA-binding domain-containing protein n=1 Tax=Gimibacter soli TaxID=3024400 RepID=A0AAF0BLZ3_9PROT|nr:LytTR family DNA-binding domain-containing protein [Gimibacter soli]WCL53776.1 LytTR family DNA-binding domain-containing protein [Gimibacter soli]
MTRRILISLLLLLGAMPAFADAYVMIDTGRVDVCPAQGESTPPDFTGADCRQVSFWDIDPQAAHLWLRALVVLGDEQFGAEVPLGLYVSGKASSRVWLNGVKLGENGVPANTPQAEVPGQMDAVFYVPQRMLKSGENEIVFELSGHHGFLHLVQPLHFIIVGPYSDGPGIAVYMPWGSLVAFGILIAGGLFFLVSAVRGEDREGSVLLSLASFLAATQLFAEISRSFIAYAYPWHDVRLMAILGCAFLFSLCLAANLLLRLTGLSRARRYQTLAGVAALMLALAAVSQGFDGMTLAVLTVPILLGVGFGIWQAFRRRRGALSYALAFAVLGALVWWQPDRFLDAYLYYAIAALLLFLFYQQAMLLADLRRERRLLARRAEHLEFVLAQAEQKAEPLRLEVTSGGQTRYVSTDRIVQFKGADDYVEIHFEDGTTSLFNGTLAALEERLPEAFLRIHRSHIANTAHVQSLTRDSNGAGQIEFANGTSAPVSRRILPKVKSALAAP